MVDQNKTEQTYITVYNIAKNLPALTKILSIAS